MSFESWIALVVALTILGLSPGPAWVAVVTTSVVRGFLPAMAMAIGIALGDLVFLFFAFFGLAVLAESLGALFIIVKYIGAAYLVWLGIVLWRNPPEAPISSPTINTSLGNPLFTGFILTLGNPKVITFYLGFLPAFVDMSNFSISDLVVIATTVFVVIGGLLSSYAALAARSRRWLVKENVRKSLGRLLGSTMVGTGVVIATRQ